MKRYVSGLDLGQTRDYTALSVLEWDETDDIQTYHESPSSLLKVFQPPPPRVYSLRHLERMRDVSYVDMVSKITSRFREPPLSGTLLAVDRTGVGAPVVDMLRRARGEHMPVLTGSVEVDTDEAQFIKRVVAGGVAGWEAAQVYADWLDERQRPDDAAAMRRIPRPPLFQLRPVTITAGAGHSIAPDGGFRVSKKELVGTLQVLLGERRLVTHPKMPLVAELKRELEMFTVKVTESANETFESWRTRDHDDLVLSVACAAWVAEHRTKQLWVR